MKFLLDSHAFVRFVLGHKRCSPSATATIEAPDSNVYLSAVTAWEIATKVRAGKWLEAAELPNELPEILRAHQFESVPITIEHGRVAGFLPGPHKDPFDRMLAAQALVDDMTLITADRAFDTFGTRTLW